MASKIDENALFLLYARGWIWPTSCDQSLERKQLLTDYKCHGAKDLRLDINQFQKYFRVSPCTYDEQN